MRRVYVSAAAAAATATVTTAKSSTSQQISQVDHPDGSLNISPLGNSIRSSTGARLDSITLQSETSGFWLRISGCK